MPIMPLPAPPVRRAARAGWRAAAAALLLSAGTSAAAPPGESPETPGATRAEGIGIVLVAVPGGTFLMGSPRGAADERPAHSVSLTPFRMGSTEVTVGQFRRFVEATGHVTDGERARTGGWRDPGFYQSDDHPVVNVSWDDAAAFCAWAGVRLPTEAEWEYAAGNGARHTRFSWGDGAPKGAAGNIADETARWYTGGRSVIPPYRDGHLFTAPVGSYPPNGLGLHDMTGNVQEWCADWYDEGWYAVSPERDPTGPAEGRFRVLRGGFWSSGLAASTVTDRRRYAPKYRAATIGFRVAADR